MCVHVVHGDGGQAVRPGPRFGKRTADEQGAQQAGPLGVSHGVELISGHACVRQRCLYCGNQMGRMGPRSELRHHSSKPRMDCLVRHTICQDLPIPNNGNARVIT